MYVIGGKKFYSNKSEDVLKDVEMYDITLNNWKTLPPLKISKYNASSIIINNNIYVFGGNNGETALDSIEKCKIEEYEW